ncbi:MAG TPA: hypothetical protein VJ963_01495 [Bacteroidales bacterium]|nr:hypothetical protein [Bacteroidales bacterium]
MAAPTETINNPSLYRKIVNKFKYGLVLESIRHQLARIGIKIVPYYWVREGMNPTSEPEIKGITSEYTTAFIEPDDINAIEEEMGSYSREGLLSYFSEDTKCLGLKYKGDLASFMFINLAECEFMSKKMKLASDEAYLTYMYTLKAYRGKNLAPYLRYKSYGILKEMGRDKIYSISSLLNSSAIRYKEKLNAKNLKLVLDIEMFKKIKMRFNLRSY